jgi:hypothetical protein
MSDCYKLENHKILQEIEVLGKNLQALQRRVISPPCLTISGFNMLPLSHITQSIDLSYKEMIYKLFIILKIPLFWIHSVENPKGNHYPLPSSLNVYLITDTIKKHVYKSLLQYIKKYNRNSVSIKLIM